MRLCNPGCRDHRGERPKRAIGLSGVADGCPVAVEVLRATPPIRPPWCSKSRHYGSTSKSAAWWWVIAA
jgi:hypothetical protein